MSFFTVASSTSDEYPILPVAGSASNRMGLSTSRSKDGRKHIDPRSKEHALPEESLRILREETVIIPQGGWRSGQGQAVGPPDSSSEIQKN